MRREVRRRNDDEWMYFGQVTLAGEGTQMEGRKQAPQVKHVENRESRGRCIGRVTLDEIKG